ncbi:MAG: ABC transporter permease subunit, partial [Deltaproteobacteria bacterium]|nr:ABC transporter permease subunit [Deltaproteobacteria bacterium]
MAQAEQITQVEVLKPPVTRVGVIGWIRQNLFNTYLNSLLTVIVIFCLYKILPPLFRWAFIDSLWKTGGAACKAGSGACWSVVTANLRFIIFGFYPHELHWRPLLAMIILITLLVFSQYRRFWNRWLAATWILSLFIMGLLMKGGLFGLTPVESTQWSGLPLTLLLSVFGLTAAYPLGVILALGRRSKMPAIKALCILYIELIRGVPLISLLFMSSVIFPLFLPEGITINKILRALA